MKEAAVEYLKYKFGPLTRENEKFFGVEMARLSKLWKRRPQDFREEIEWGQIPEELKNRIAAALLKKYQFTELNSLTGIENDRRRFLDLYHVDRFKLEGELLEIEKTPKK